MQPFLKKALDKESCKKFIQKNISETTNILDDFDKLKDQGGFVLAPRKSYENYTVYAVGRTNSGNAKLLFNYNPNPFPAKSFISAYVATRVLVSTLIHELIHLTKDGGSDWELAERFYKSGLDKKPPPKIEDYAPGGDKSKLTPELIYKFAADSSSYWDKHLDSACLPTDEEFKQWWQNWGLEK